MSQILEVHPWLTVNEAASYLTRVSGNRVMRKDLFRLAREGQLKISVDLPHGTVAALPENAGSTKGYTEPIDGVWDLPAEGLGKAEIDRQYRESMDGNFAEVPLVRGTEGARVTRGETIRTLMTTLRGSGSATSCVAIPSAAEYVIRREELGFPSCRIRYRHGQAQRAN